MAEFLVAIERKITYQVRVTADTAAQARAQVIEYGEQEAWADYDCVEENNAVRIASVKRMT